MRTICDGGAHSFKADVKNVFDFFFPQLSLSLTDLDITYRRCFLLHILAIVWDPIPFQTASFLTYWQTNTAHSGSLFSVNVSHSTLKHGISSSLWCHFCTFPCDMPVTHPSDFLFPSFIPFLATSSPVKEHESSYNYPFYSQEHLNRSVCFEEVSHCLSKGGGMGLGSLSLPQRVLKTDHLQNIPDFPQSHFNSQSAEVSDDRRPNFRVWAWKLKGTTEQFPDCKRRPKAISELVSRFDLFTKKGNKWYQVS